MNPPTLDDIEKLSHPALILRHRRVLSLLAAVWKSRRALQAACGGLASELAEIKAVDPDLFDPDPAAWDAVYESYGVGGRHLREDFLGVSGPETGDGAAG
ncbi:MULTISPECIES: hypothetical protein [Nocardia]|uniref:hypothetical protein n=1 Tax=Nocardia TaxID=1817 RepID=UPI0024582378|nr:MULTISPECIES: hypothetical protein [Nocardia]